MRGEEGGYPQKEGREKLGVRRERRKERGVCPRRTEEQMNRREGRKKADSGSGSQVGV